MHSRFKFFLLFTALFTLPTLSFLSCSRHDFSADRSELLPLPELSQQELEDLEPPLNSTREEYLQGYRDGFERGLRNSPTTELPQEDRAPAQSDHEDRTLEDDPSAPFPNQSPFGEEEHAVEEVTDAPESLLV